MIKRLKSMKDIIGYNFKTFIVFEIIYRFMGVLLILPLTRLLFYSAIRISGHQYITNQMLLDFITEGSSLFMLFILLIVFGLYIAIEMIFLSVIYDYGYHKVDLSFMSLLVLGFKQTIRLLKKYHIFLVIPSLVLVFVFEAIHIVGFASTISLPRVIVEEAQNFLPLQIIFYSASFLILLLFVESMFYLKFFTLESDSLKHTIHEHRVFIKNYRLRYMFKFLGYNLLLNIVLYSFYALTLLLISFFIFITRDQSYVLGTLLSVLYSFYFVIMTLSTLVLIPFNYALISSWYYERRSDKVMALKFESYRKRFLKSPDLSFLKPILLVSFGVLIGLNITNVVSMINQPRSQVEIFKRADIVAHRGASLGAPENTVSAIELALSQSADGVEFDVWVSSDGIPVLMHDPTLGRTTNDNLNRRVDSLTLDELKTLDAGSWFSEEFAEERIPTLEEALETIDKKAVAYIDLKASGTRFNQSVVDLIETYDLENYAIVMSFDQNQLKEIKSMNENIQTLLLISTFFGNIQNLINDNDIDNLAFRTFVLTQNPDYVRQVQRAGKNVYVWTLETRESHEEFVELDVDGLITKDVLLAKEVVYSRNTSSLFYRILNQLFKP